MGTLLSIVDFIVLALFVIYITGIVRRDSGSLILSIFIALAVLIFGVVSFTANAGLIAASSLLTQGIVLVVLLGVAATLIALSAASKPAA